MHTNIPVFTSIEFRNKYISTLRGLYSKDQTDFQTIYDENDLEYRLEGWSLFRFKEDIISCISLDEAITKIGSQLEEIDRLTDDEILNFYHFEEMENE